jgi:hypothetical protein
MTRRGSTAAAQPFPWSSLAIIAAAAEAVVIALWLIPSSVHIVSWPADGPVRVGLLGSARVLLGAAAATLAISAILVTWLRSTVWPRRLSSALAPLLLFWTWAVPYLPVLPDRMPLLLVLSGPVRWGIAGAVFLAVLSQATGVRTQQSALVTDEPVLVNCHTTRADLEDARHLAELGIFCRTMGRDARQGRGWVGKETRGAPN